VGGYVASKIAFPNRLPLDPEARSALGAPLEVSFPSRAGEVTLAGWFFPGGPRAVVLVHGLDGNRAVPPVLHTIPFYRQLGWSVLAFDLRGHGESGAARLGMGQWEKGDVLGAMDFLASQGIPPTQVLLHGWSLGAVATILAAADCEAGPLGVVADSAYSRLVPVLMANLHKRTGLPSFVNWGVLLMGRLLFGLNPWQVRADLAAGELHRRGIPLLLIHGEDDELVPLGHAREILSAHPEARAWFVPDCGHALAWEREEYFRVLSSFLENLS
jgi:pimeloyl-ACP methyl ester carboxylesterase